MIRVTLVPGTHAWRDDPAQWWHPQSRFVQFLHDHGYDLVSRQSPFVWSTDINGVLDRAHRDWRSGGVNLFAYLVPPLCPDRRVLPGDCHVIAHSHGGQVALYAAAYGLKIDTLVTVATPVRGDMATIAKVARPNIRFWRHLHSGRRDWMQVLGGLFDGRVGVERAHPLADENVKIDAAGHSGVLNDAQYYPRWVTEWLPQEGQ